MKKFNEMTKEGEFKIGNMELTENPDPHTEKFNSLRHQDYAQDIKLKKHFAWATYVLIFLWLIAVLATLNYSEHSTWVLVALISTSTIKVLGLYYVVLKYIFPN